MIRGSEHLVLQRLLAAELKGNAGEKAFTVRGIEGGLTLSDRSVREALRRLVRLRLARVAGVPGAGATTKAGSTRPRRARNVYHLTPEGRDAALGRPAAPIRLPLAFRMEFPIPAAILLSFLLDPRRTGVGEPDIIRTGRIRPSTLCRCAGCPSSTASRRCRATGL